MALPSSYRTSLSSSRSDLLPTMIFWTLGVVFYLICFIHFSIYWLYCTQILKSSAIVDAIGKYHAGCPSIVGLSDGPESFLTGGIPEL